MINFDFSYSRRQWLKIMGTLLFFLGGKRQAKAVTLPANLSSSSASASISRVILAHHEKALNSSNEPQPEITRFLVEESLKTLTGEKNIKSAWRKFVSLNDIVGLKVNSMSYPTTHTALTYAVADSLIASGVPANNIIIWDQLWENLQRAGYQINQTENGVRCYGCNSFGKILIKKFRWLQYESTPASFGTANSRLSKIFTQHCTAIINLPILKDHYIAGITATMKSFIGSVYNPEDYHPNNGNPYLADLNGISQIKQKVKLNILDILSPLYQGGPHGEPRCQWQYKGIMVGTDRIAMDYLGWQIIETKRQELGLKSLQDEHRSPTYILTAAKKGLGIADKNRIEVVELNFT